MESAHKREDKLETIRRGLNPEVDVKRLTMAEVVPLFRSAIVGNDEMYTQPIWRSFYLPSQRKLHRNFVIDRGLPKKKKNQPSIEHISCSS